MRFVQPSNIAVVWKHAVCTLSNAQANVLAILILSVANGRLASSNWQALLSHTGIPAAVCVCGGLLDWQAL
jgi:hypothetical protein